MAEIKEQKKETMEKFYATGKRKTAIARVWICQNDKEEITINKKKIKEYFKQERYQTDITKPFNILKTNEIYKVSASVKGSGLTGQASAIRLGISKALCSINYNNRKILKPHGLITRDSRKVERKKYGQPKARKKFQFSKR